MMRPFIARHWFLLCLGLLMVLGFTMAERLAFIADATRLRDVIVAFVLFCTALSLETRQLSRTIGRPLPSLTAVALNYGLLPLLAVVLSKVLPGELADGLVIASAVPCTIASAAVWTRRAHGNDALALVVTVVTHLICFLLAPFWMWSAGIGIGTTLTLGAMIGKLAKLVLFPMMAAQIIRQHPVIGKWATAQKMRLSIVAQMGLLVVVLMGAVKCGLAVKSGQSRLQWQDVLLMLTSVAMLHTTVLLLGRRIAERIGFSREDCVAIGIAGSQKTLMIGLLLAMSAGGGLRILPMVAYHLLQLVIDTVVADRWREAGDRRGSREDKG